ncbi:MAG: hypothetical protein ACRCW2_00700 [Cellulosilyticaceae bacterium]
MQEVIEQIMQIDSKAYENKTKNVEKLEEKRKQYEAQMKAYESEKIGEAQRQADLLYQKMVEVGKESSRVEEEKSKQVALQIENKYLQIEATLLAEIFETLFVLE